jgi:hypothetical protein
VLPAQVRDDRRRAPRSARVRYGSAPASRSRARDVAQALRPRAHRARRAASPAQRGADVSPLSSPRGAAATARAPSSLAHGRELSRAPRAPAGRRARRPRAGSRTNSGTPRRPRQSSARMLGHAPSASGSAPFASSQSRHARRAGEPPSSWRARRVRLLLDERVQRPVVAPARVEVPRRARSSACSAPKDRRCARPPTTICA